MQIVALGRQWLSQVLQSAVQSGSASSGSRARVGGGGSDKITCDNVAASGANLHTECRTFSRSLVSACSSVCERRLPTS